VVCHELDNQKAEDAHPKLWRELRLTHDGSHTVYATGLDETYHSIHGAVQESRHVFINQGFDLAPSAEIRILEAGFGTGLNALLTFIEAERKGRRIYYHTVEKFPLSSVEYGAINHEKQVETCPPGLCRKLHDSRWGTPVALADHFTLFKEKADFRKMNPSGRFDLVYYDAFDPAKQPELWNDELFSKLYSTMIPGAILVTYSAKGSVRRALESSGFRVERIPGPPGKREMIRAFRK
jgi:tRNA U34 5-methylaminomethyl-2-thiouridine-forming methyltransferase MnmC